VLKEFKAFLGEQVVNEHLEEATKLSGISSKILDFTVSIIKDSKINGDINNRMDNLTVKETNGISAKPTTKPVVNQAPNDKTIQKQKCKRYS
jgi:hypothetical protein